MLHSTLVPRCLIKILYSGCFTEDTILVFSTNILIVLNLVLENMIFLHFVNVFHWNGADYPSLWHKSGLAGSRRLVSSQWETSLQSNAVSHWLGTNLESVLIIRSDFLAQPNTIGVHGLATHGARASTCQQLWYWHISPGIFRSIQHYKIWYIHNCGTGLVLPEYSGRFNIIRFTEARLTHLSLNKMAAISQATFSYAFSWMKCFVFW